MHEVCKAYKKKYGQEVAIDVMAKLHRESASLVAQIANKQPAGKKVNLLRRKRRH